jgi:tRNA(Met) C34 N-acetyltransferase TmcA
VLTALQARQVELLAGGLKIGAVEEARIHIALLAFFMERKQKDAAYLSADAARRLLAKAVQKKTEAEQASALTTKLDTLEGQLRQTMPY